MRSENVGSLASPECCGCREACHGISTDALGWQRSWNGNDDFNQTVLPSKSLAARTPVPTNNTWNHVTDQENGEANHASVAHMTANKKCGTTLSHEYKGIHPRWGLQARLTHD